MSKATELFKTALDEVAEGARRAGVALQAAIEAWHESGVDDSPPDPPYSPYDDVTRPTGPAGRS